MESMLQLLLTRQCCWLATIVAFALVPCSASAQDTLRPDKTSADLLCVTDTWAVWRTSDLIGSTTDFRSPSFVHRLYRQRLSEPEARLVHTETDGRVEMLTTVTKNGTVALVKRGRLSWHPPNGTNVVEERTYPINILALYPDGAVRYDSTGRGRFSVFFVSFKNDRLDMSSQIEIIPAARDIHPPIARHGSLLAWILMDVREGPVSSPTDSWDATLHVYDLESGKQRSVKLGVPLHKSYRATAFDGDILMAFSYVFDAKTGKNLNAVAYPTRPPHLHEVFAVRNRIGYYILNESLFATDLLSRESPSIRLASAPKNGDCAQTAAGLIVWNGKKWEIIPWLKEWPRTSK